MPKSFSYGTARIDDYEEISVEALIRASDHKMYEYKLEHILAGEKYLRINVHNKGGKNVLSGLPYAYQIFV